jgi:hypothetical protein
MAIDRKSKTFEIVCPDCKEVRFVTYAQHWNIRVSNSSGLTTDTFAGRVTKYVASL